MSTMLHQPHQILFRKAMRYEKVAKEIFSQHLPSSLQKSMDWTQLKIQTATFIAEDQKCNAADMLYEVKIHNKPAYLYLVCDASISDELLAFRLVKYIIRILEQLSEQNKDKAFPAIYPLIFYTGNTPRKQTLDRYNFFGAQQNFMYQVFIKPCQLINVCEIKDEELRPYLWGGTLGFIYKYRFKRPLTDAVIQQIGCCLGKLEQQGAFDYALILLQYLWSFYDPMQANAFIARLNPYLTPSLEKEMMTISEQFRYEGLRQGIQQGIDQGIRRGVTQGENNKAKAIARKMQNQGVDLALIEKFTGLAKAQIVALAE